jgi:hypothetical protein
MNWLRRLLRRKPVMVFLLEYETFFSEKQTMGVFDNDQDAYEFFLFSSRGRMWCEGDRYSLFVVDVNDYYWDGVQAPVVWQTIHGLFFSTDGYRRRFEDFRDNHFIYQGRESIIDECSEK